jgi:hypothetical protein
VTGRTVRWRQTDGPWWTVRKNSPRNQCCTSKYEWSVPYPQTVREQPVPWGRSETGGGDGPQTARNENLETPWIETPLVQELKNKGRTRVLMDCTPTRSGWSARHAQSYLSSKMRSQPLVSIRGSPKRLELLRQDLGEMSSVPGGCYDPKLEPSNELKYRESMLCF